ncbi:Ripening-related protein grip22 [Vitis vinifera]|uniref:Ripening-related protein grip22 n=1 Tax=Vitis vinifera TaxID=29760 RepID=A0A438CGJ4_VITVI|nr:Ripening-related protein grip22 [Vitis vinifera]
MANSALVWLASVCLVFNILSLPFLALGLSSCGGSCQTLNDCEGQLICINGKCNDDPRSGLTYVEETRVPLPLHPPVPASPRELLRARAENPKIPTHALLRSPPPRLPF